MAFFNYFQNIKITNNNCDNQHRKIQGRGNCPYSPPADALVYDHVECHCTCRTEYIVRSPDSLTVRQIDRDVPSFRRTKKWTDLKIVLASRGDFTGPSIWRSMPNIAGDASLIGSSLAASMMQELVSIDSPSAGNGFGRVVKWPDRNGSGKLYTSPKFRRYISSLQADVQQSSSDLAEPPFSFDAEHRSAVYFGRHRVYVPARVSIETSEFENI